ncbi:MAG: hypothetical protein ACE5RI_09775 [Candidatus Nitrosomaritimum yanchengensis]
MSKERALFIAKDIIRFPDQYIWAKYYINLDVFIVLPMIKPAPGKFYVVDEKEARLLIGNKNPHFKNIDDVKKIMIALKKERNK